MTNVFSGQKLRQARVFHGMSLQDLGKKLNDSSKQYIQQMECGTKIPNHDTVMALAQLLEVQPGYFFETDNAMISEEYCHFRSRKTTPASLKSQSVEHVNILNKIAVYLDINLDLPTTNFPSYERSQKAEDIEKIADDCRRHWKLGSNSPITNMTRVLENAGAIVTYFSDVSGKIDAFSAPGQRYLIIRNPEKNSACRMRFDLAHECGHLVMHAGIVTGDSETEAEANRFASAFLLPRTAFINEFGSAFRGTYIQWHKLYELKLRWKVSIAAIIRRAHDLNMIDAVKYRGANIYLNKTRQMRKEKYDDMIPMETPETINKALDILKIDNLGIKSIAEYLKVMPNFISKVIGDIELSMRDKLRIHTEGKIIFLHT